MHGDQPHQRHTVHHHPTLTVIMLVIVDMKIHEHHVCQQIVDQQVLHDTVSDQCSMVYLQAHPEVMEFQIEQ
jgi:hypothetical protein